jgi:hopanoid biosynthesis associated RND transporter like protein HpnN
MERCLDELAVEIQKKPEAYDRLFYKVDLTSLANRKLLLASTAEIRQIQDELEGMSLLLDTPVITKFLDASLSWRSLSVWQLFREGDRRLFDWKTDQANEKAERFFKQLESICTGAAAVLDGKQSYGNPWRSILSANDRSAQDFTAKPQYFFSGDGKLAFLTVGPVKDSDSSSFTSAQRSIDALRELLTQMKERHPELEFGLTGLPVLENDEMNASQNDSNFASWLALAGVALLYLVVYRGFRYPLMTVAALMVGTVWALGWLTLTVGHLNILSSAFAVMLIGMGDYGVLWVTRFGQERQAGFDIHAAMRQTALHAGPSILTAAVTTAFAFFAAMLADLKAVSELGWIAGSGVLLCALSCFVVTPALLAIFDFRVRPRQANDQMILSIEDHRAARREWLPALMHRPRWVIGASAFVTLLLAGCALGIDYDHNLLNMQAPQMESVQWEKTLLEHTADSSWYAVSWTTTPEEALALKAKYEQLPGVSKVETLASAVPCDQERKLELLRDIQQRLKRLPTRGEIVEHGIPNLDDIAQSGTRLVNTLARLQKEQANEALGRCEASVRNLLAVIARHDREQTQYQLKQYEELMTRDLATNLHVLRDASTPAPIALTDLPESLRERNIGKNGKWLLRIFSKQCLWNFEPLEEFVNQVRTIDAEATGKPFTTLEGLKAMRNGFLWAGFYALIVMVIVLLLDFGNVKHTLVALLPLAMGMIATLGFMAMFGVALNPANMIAFPLILGVGADNGVHVLHDFRGRDRKKRYHLSHVTGFGIMVAALTTILGFGTLMIAQHRGMASLGLFLTLGVSCCMLTALVFLPALLCVLDRRKAAATVPAPVPTTETEYEAA